MPNLNRESIIAQIDLALSTWADAVKASKARYDKNLNTVEVATVINVMLDTISRLSPPHSCYWQNANDAVQRLGSYNEWSIPVLAGILQALRAYYQSDNLLSVTSMVRAELFSDFVEMAEYLLTEGYKDAAAVIAGGVLEGHLCKLCENNSLPIKENDKRLKADRLNADLVKANVYGKLDQKSVIQWLDLRNHAAHGEYKLYTKEQVAFMIQGITDFMSRCPA